NATGFLSPSVAGTPAITIPVVAVTADRGALINGRLVAGAVTMTWTNQVASEPSPTANLISSFSSYGPAPDLSFKPDIGAPGGTVRSTLPLEQGGYGTSTAPSMSRPHAPGAGPLLPEPGPQLTPEEVQQRSSTTPTPR